jgi:hypothetical protein
MEVTAFSSPFDPFEEGLLLPSEWESQPVPPIGLSEDRSGTADIVAE